MDGQNVMEVIDQALNEMLIWVGFGTLVGLAAKAIMPGKDPGGAVATVVMGIGGSVIGCGSLLFFVEGARVTPISGPGFLAATGGAFIILFFYRLMSGHFFSESEDGDRYLYRRSRRRRRRELLSD